MRDGVQQPFPKRAPRLSDMDPRTRRIVTLAVLAVAVAAVFVAAVVSG